MNIFRWERINWNSYAFKTETGKFSANFSRDSLSFSVKELTKIVAIVIANAKVQTMRSLVCFRRVETRLRINIRVGNAFELSAEIRAREGGNRFSKGLSVSVIGFVSYLWKTWRMSRHAADISILAGEGGTSCWRNGLARRLRKFQPTDKRTENGCRNIGKRLRRFWLAEIFIGS